MEREQNLDEVLQTTLSRLQSMVDVNYTVGSAIKNEYGDTIVPICKMTVAFVHGGGEYGVKKSLRNKRNTGYPFAGGTGAGCTVDPVGFLVVSKTGVTFINTNADNTINKFLDVAAKFLSNLKK
ncbi:MAG: hypothetical protein LBN07_03085 [Christensenellaceae bacterium]|nr:hypothetical protein [Christensenellaceae bacterium]